MEVPSVIGLGYVGLPLAVALARHYDHTIAFDADPERVSELRTGFDRTGEVESHVLRETSAQFTSDVTALTRATAHVVAVPTPVTAGRRPDLALLAAASRTVGRVLRQDDVVIYESTVYPGVTEDFCGPILEAESGLPVGGGFGLGYSPERINPGDKAHTLETIVKVVAGDSTETLERVAAIYERIVPAGVHRVSSIRVAEAAKVIENTQRDVNIALMNELAMIFDRMGISTRDVLAAACTKWNFLPFRPGLVGGHCIGVDPYYLAYAAETVGVHPDMILSGRRTNSAMGQFVAQKTLKLLASSGIPVTGARIAVLGMAFKENIPDFRNSQAPAIIEELAQYGTVPLPHDPLVAPAAFERAVGIRLAAVDELTHLDAVVLAAPHQRYLERDGRPVVNMLRRPGVLADVTAALDPRYVPEGITYWSL